MDLETYKKRERNNVTEQTLSGRMSALRRFEDFVEGEPTVEDVDEYADHLIELFEDGELSSSTVRQYYKAVRYYFDMMQGNADELDYISKRLPAAKNDHGDYLTKKEWQMMRENAHEYRIDAILEIMYKYGRRPGEVIALNESDVDLENEEITFPILKKEETLRAKFELFDSPKEKINSYMKYKPSVTVEPEKEWEEDEVKPLFVANGRISYDTVWRKVKQVAERAGIDKNITPKSMRHTRATHLDWEGNSPEEIARHQLIHEPDTDVISAYIHDREEEQLREPMKLEEEK
jgi:integrase/recombinase XerD